MPLGNLVVRLCIAAASSSARCVLLGLDTSGFMDAQEGHASPAATACVAPPAAVRAVLPTAWGQYTRISVCPWMCFPGRFRQLAVLARPCVHTVTTPLMRAATDTHLVFLVRSGGYVETPLFSEV